MPDLPAMWPPLAFLPIFPPKYLLLSPLKKFLVQQVENEFLIKLQAAWTGMLNREGFAWDENILDILPSAIHTRHV